MSDVVLECAGIDLELSGTQILSAVDLSVRRGEIHVLIGPNGAGKTMLANVITGHVAPTRGTVRLDGVALTGPAWRRARAGIGRKFQIPRVFGRLSVAENLDLVDADHLTADGARLGGELPHGERQALELRMVLGQNPRLLVLDEPTSGLEPAERDELAELLVRRRGTTTMLVVEHDLDFVARIADRVTVLFDGRLHKTGTFGSITADPLVRATYLGTVGALP